MQEKGYRVAQGTVARFDPRRGYGFVRPDDGGEDVFVHQNNIVMEGFRYLKPGEQVNYELEIGEKGYKAVQVQLISPRQAEDHPFQGDEAPAGERPRYERSYERSYERNAPPRRQPRQGGDERLAQEFDRLRRKQERLISLMVAKGVLAPGEVDGVVETAPATEVECTADDDATLDEATAGD